MQPVTPPATHSGYIAEAASVLAHIPSLLQGSHALCTLGLFGLIHSGKSTAVPGGNQALLSPSNIQVDSYQDHTYAAITLCGSKTDPFGVGGTVFIGCTNSTSICPVTALHAYLEVRPPSPGLLYIYDHGSPLIRSGLVPAVCAALL